MIESRVSDSHCRSGELSCSPAGATVAESSDRASECIVETEIEAARCSLCSREVGLEGVRLSEAGTTFLLGCSAVLLECESAAFDTTMSSLSLIEIVASASAVTTLRTLIHGFVFDQTVIMYVPVHRFVETCLNSGLCLHHGSEVNTHLQEVRYGFGQVGLAFWKGI